MTGDTIFRKSSMNQVSSPEQLNDYIKVSSPSVWLILGAVIVLLISVCVWSVFGTLTTTEDAVTVVLNGKGTCYVTLEEAMSLTIGMEVNVGDSIGSILSIDAVPLRITEDFNPYALYLSGFEAGDWVIPVVVETYAPDGVYMARIVLETIEPISLVLN